MRKAEFIMRFRLNTKKKSKIILIILIALLIGSSGFVFSLYRGFGWNTTNAEFESSSTLTNEGDSAIHSNLPAKRYVSNKIYPHMGTKECLEHTFEGYDLALSQGSRVVDQDLVVSKNGTFWVSHDTLAKRVFGVDREFKDMTDGEIRNLSYLQSPKTKILSFEDVVVRYGKTVDYSIEIKTGHENLTSFINLIRRYNLSDNIIFSSFPETRKAEPNKVFQLMKQTFPNIRTMAIITNQTHFSTVLNISYINEIALYSPLLNQFNVNLAHQYGKKLNIWVLNTKDQIRNALKLGVDSYYTDYTNLGVEVEQSF